MAIIVGGVLEKEGKYLLVQEAQEKCYGKWNLPAGCLESNETLFEAAIREIKEESGLDVKLTGVCQLGNKKLEDDIFISIVFSTIVLSDNIKFDSKEILDARWFSYEELLSMRAQLRSEKLILGAINNLRNKLVASISIVEMLE